MFSTLRGRLLISYIILISLTLCIAGMALMLLLVNSTLLDIQTYERLATIAAGQVPQIRGDQGTLNEQLQTIADEENIRILRINANEQIVFDSAGQLSGSLPDSITILPGRQQPAGERIIRGRFDDASGQRWYFVALNPGATPNRDVGRLILAVPRRQYLGELLGVFFRPLFRAGLVGLCGSVLLAILISSSVARPLKQLGEAARIFADGNYDHRVPESGPREVQELGQSFNDMANRVQQSQQTQADFLANVSHDLKTPLTSIQGFAQAILDGMAADPTTAARVIHDEAGRMRRMVDDLLDLARIESGQTPMRREWVEVDKLLSGICENLSIQAESEGITLIHQIDHIPRMTGDNDRLAQVFINLIGNALTHTPAGGQVSVTTRPARDGVEIVVSDTGKGIPQEDLSRIFERFYQADKSRTRSGTKGTGLGLTISKEIVEIHGGTIRAESELGQGATFIVWLPLPRPQDETVARSSRHR